MNKLRMIVAAALVTISFASCLIEAPPGPGRGYGGRGYGRGHGQGHGSHHGHHGGHGHHGH